MAGLCCRLYRVRYGHIACERTCLEGRRRCYRWGRFYDIGMPFVYTGAHAVASCEFLSIQICIPVLNDCFLFALPAWHFGAAHRIERGARFPYPGPWMYGAASWTYHAVFL